MGKPQILPDRCIRGLSRRVGCRACEQSCSKGAIVIREAPFHISVNEKCDGCGLCWTKCPAEAILPSHDVRDPIRLGLGVLCQRAGADPKEIAEDAVLRVPCVKEIGFRFLAARWMSGLRRLVVHGADCSECNVVAPSKGEDGVRQANELLHAAGKESIDIVHGESLRRPEGRARVGTSDEAQRATSRRGLLKTMIAESFDAAFPSTLDESDTKEGADAPVAFLEALHGLGNGKEQEGKGRLAAYRLAIDARVCYGCRVCATLCPTGALDWVEDPETPDRARMRIDPSRCHGCGACVDLCDVGAVDCTFWPELRVQHEIVFREGRCTACNRFFLFASRPEQALCPGCRRHEGASGHVPKAGVFPGKGERRIHSRR